MSRESSPIKQIASAFSFSQFEILVALFVCAGLIFYAASPFYYNSETQQYFQSLKQTYGENQTTYMYVSEQINSNEHVANATVFAVWAIVGLLLYYVVYYFSRSEHDLSMFIGRLFGGHADVKSELEEAFIHSSIRINALLLLLLFSLAFVRMILPFAIVNFDVVGSQPLSQILTNLAMATASLLISAHVYVVLLRCLFLRQRLFF